MRYKVTTEKKGKTDRYRNRPGRIYAVLVFMLFINLSCAGFFSKNIYAADQYQMQKTSVVIKTGASYTAKILNNNKKVNLKNFKWSSSNLKYAKVVNGKIYGLKPGTATITAQKNQVKLSCEVYVCNKTEAVPFRKYKNQVKITAGKTLLLEPQKCGKKITYSSSDKGVATVSKKGKVTAKKVGSTKITCISYGTNRYVSEIEVVVTKQTVTPVPSVTPEITPTLVPEKPTPSITPAPEPTPTDTPAPEPSVTPELTPTATPEKPDVPEITPTPTPEEPKDFQKPLDGTTCYILHRGDQTVAPENSMPAFEAAGRGGAEYVETDIRETKDGVLVLSHDDSLQRMCGENKLISELTYEEVKQYPIINGTNASQYPDNVVPTLEEYLACCNKYSMTPVIEIKSISTEEGMSSFMQLLSKSQKKPILICFRIDTLRKLRELGFDGKMQWIRTARVTNTVIQQCKKYNLDISVEYWNVSMYDISNVHQNGIRISIWLCQNEDMVDIFRKMGADYITYEKWNTDNEE